MLEDHELDRRREALVSLALVVTAIALWSVRFWAQSPVASLLGLGVLVFFVIRQGFLVSARDPDEESGSYLRYGFTLALSTFAPTAFCGVSHSSDAVPGADLVAHVATAGVIATLGWGIHAALVCERERVIAIVLSIFQLGIALVGWVVAVMAVRGVWL